MDTTRRFRTVTIVAALAVLLVLGACGSDDDGVEAGSEQAATEVAVGAGDADTASDAAEVPDDESDEPVGEAEAADEPAESEYASFTEQDAIEAAMALEAAYNEFDEAKYLAATTADYRFVDERGVTPRDVQVTFLPGLRDLRQSGESTSEYRVTGDGPFIVAVDATIRNSSYEPEGRMGTSTMTVVLEDGVLRVAEHRWTGDPL